MWIDREKFYALGIDGDGKRIETITSNPGHLLFTGILDLEESRNVVRRLLKPDLITRYGIRTQSTLSSDFDELSYQRGSIWPYDNWMIALGMKSLGYDREYALIRESILGLTKS